MNPSPITPTQYLVYSADEKHVGPVTAELIGRGVVAGKVPEDAYIAPAGTTAWAPIAAYPDIVEAMRTHKSSLRPSASFGALHTPPPPPPPAVPQDLFTGPISSPPASLPLPQIHAAPTVVSPPPAPTVVTPPPPSVNVAVAPVAPMPIAPVPAAPVAPAAAPPAPTVEAAPASLAVPSAAEPKKEEKKPALDPKWKLLPVAIFGVFGFIAVLETIIVLVARR